MTTNPLTNLPNGTFVCLWMSRVSISIAAPGGIGVETNDEIGPGFSDGSATTNLFLMVIAPEVGLWTLMAVKYCPGARTSPFDVPMTNFAEYWDCCAWACGT